MVFFSSLVVGVKCICVPCPSLCGTLCLRIPSAYINMWNIGLLLAACCRMGVLYIFWNQNRIARVSTERCKIKLVTTGTGVCLLLLPRINNIQTKNGEILPTDISSISVDDIVCRSVVISDRKVSFAHRIYIILLLWLLLFLFDSIPNYFLFRSLLQIYTHTHTHERTYTRSTVIGGLYSYVRMCTNRSFLNSVAVLLYMQCCMGNSEYFVLSWI